jgi:nitrogen fixation NifU-like protein
MSDRESVSATARERFDHPRNYGPLDNWSGHARITGPCGDTIEIWLDIDNGKIARAGFVTDGCGSSRACGSMATELATGRSPEDAAGIEQAEILAALGGLPEKSRHCARLAADTLHAAIRDYRQRTANASEAAESR